MKTPNEILNEVATENMINIQQMVTTKQLAIIAMRRYAKLYHENEVKKLSLSDVSKCDSNERKALLIAFLQQQNKLHYVTIYENDFEFAGKLLKAINCC